MVDSSRHYPVFGYFTPKTSTSSEDGMCSAVDILLGACGLIVGIGNQLLHLRDHPIRCTATALCSHAASFGLDQEHSVVKQHQTVQLRGLPDPVFDNRVVEIRTNIGVGENDLEES
jgi:hypothetical protein